MKPNSSHLGSLVSFQGIFFPSPCVPPCTSSLTVSLTHSLIPKHFLHLFSPSSLPLKPLLPASLSCGPPSSPYFSVCSSSSSSSSSFLRYLRPPLPSSLVYLKREGPRGVLLHSGQSSCPVNLGYEQTEPFLSSPS